jgi:hypothetical protein
MNSKSEINKPARIYGYINTQLHHNYENRQKKIKEVWMLTLHSIKIYSRCNKFEVFKTKKSN